MAGAGYGTKSGSIPAVKGTRRAEPIKGARAKAALVPEALRAAHGARMSAVLRAFDAVERAKKARFHLVASKASKKSIAAAVVAEDAARARLNRVARGKNRLIDAYEARTGSTLRSHLNRGEGPRITTESLALSAIARTEQLRGLRGVRDQNRATRADRMAGAATQRLHKAIARGVMGSTVQVYQVSREQGEKRLHLVDVKGGERKMIGHVTVRPEGHWNVNHVKASDAKKAKLEAALKAAIAANPTTRRAA